MLTSDAGMHSRCKHVDDVSIPIHSTAASHIGHSFDLMTSRHLHSDSPHLSASFDVSADSRLMAK